MIRPTRFLGLVLAALAAGCGRDGLDAEALRDPASCAGCHPDQVREWSGSMHAYASDDPVFLAMNALGQRATGGALGSLCVGCHAPVAVATGATVDGLDLAQVPRSERGVTCVACHQLEEVTQLHNGGLGWSFDGVMRGGLGGPVATGGHASVRAALVDSTTLGSSEACGACHEVVLPGDLGIETTYSEWASSLFARAPLGLSCASCHMAGRDAPAAVGGPTRRVHSHAMPGLDVALTAWPEVDAQRAAIDGDLQGAVSARLCVTPTGGGVEVEVTLDNVQVGHAFPSGVTHARRVWVELVAETAGEAVWQRGQFAPGEIIHAGDDPDVWVLGSRFLDAGGAEVQAVWEAAALDSDVLAPSVTIDPTDPAYYHAQVRTWSVPGSPDVIRLVVHVQPVGLDVLDGLIDSGDLDPAVRARVPTFEVRGAAHEWRADRDGFGCAP